MSDEKVREKQETFAKIDKKDAEYIDDTQILDAFAQGLPEWNLEPPQLLVKRKGDI